MPVLGICIFCFLLMFFFFKQKTAYEMRISDWSSDVCSSDLVLHDSRRGGLAVAMLLGQGEGGRGAVRQGDLHRIGKLAGDQRGEGRLGRRRGAGADRKSVV